MRRNLKAMLLNARAFKSGDWFTATDVMPIVSSYELPTYQRALEELASKGYLERGSVNGYYRKIRLQISRETLADLVVEIDAGRTDIKSESAKFPVHYETLRKHIRQFRDGVGIYS